jgi:hypothetical protein
MEMPLSVQKERFSADTTAFLMLSGICLSVIGWRFCTAKLPSWVLPSL